MRKNIYLIIAALSLAVSCTKFDDSAIWEKFREHEERITKLETLCNRLNTNISAMQALLTALEGNDYITGITPVMECGKEVGYTIYFSKGLPMTIYHGSNGEDAPKVGVRKASDGEYYWTVGDEWLTDDEGSMIPAETEDENGNMKYVTPQLRVTEGCWYVSYDGGNTWQILGEVEEDEEEKQTFIVDIQKDENYYIFYFSNGTLFKIPAIRPEQISGSHWKGKVWYAYGTSLTSTSVGRYVNYVAELSGLEAHNKGIPGGGIIANTKVKNAIMNTTDGKLNADLITLEVGANDAKAELGNPWDNGEDTFCGALTQCINYLLQNTNAQIVVMSSPLGKTTSGGSSTEQTEENHKNMTRNQYIREVCQKCCVYYIGLGDSSGLGWGRTNNNMGISYNADYIHQNELGGYNLAQYIWSELKDIPLWYTSIPQPDNNLEDDDNDGNEEGSEDVTEPDTPDLDYLFYHNHNDLVNNSFLGTQYFYFSDSDVIESLNGKTVNGAWCMIGKANTSNCKITAYLVDLNNPAPTNWTEIGSTTVKDLPIGSHVAFDLPETLVPENHTIGFRASTAVIATVKGKNSTITRHEMTYYDNADATTTKSLTTSAYDIRLK